MFEATVISASTTLTGPVVSPGAPPSKVSSVPALHPTKTSTMARISVAEKRLLDHPVTVNFPSRSLTPPRWKGGRGRIRPPASRSREPSPSRRSELSGPRTETSILSIRRRALRRPAVQAPLQAVGQVDQGQAYSQVDKRRHDQRRRVGRRRLQDPSGPQELR